MDNLKLAFTAEALQSIDTLETAISHLYTVMAADMNAENAAEQLPSFGFIPDGAFTALLKTALLTDTNNRPAVTIIATHVIYLYQAPTPNKK
jgi:hypothetical protein